MEIPANQATPGPAPSRTGNAPSTLADACPGCAAATRPAWVHAEPGGALCAHYHCGGCAVWWRTGWDARAAGWPQSREAA